MSVRISSDLMRLFEDTAAADDLKSGIVNDEAYTLELEYGSSKQAPQGMYRAYIGEYLAMLTAEMAGALADNPTAPLRALGVGFDAGVIDILRALEDRTPIKTGEAASSWVAILQDGRRVSARHHSGLRTKRA